MMSAPEQFDDLVALLAGYEQGRLSEQELAALNDRLRDDEQARQWFNEYFQLAAAIRGMYQVSASSEMSLHAADRAADRPAPRRLHLIRYIAAAAVILLAAAAW